ncbi:RagB/SusD family nutrient uptake outer membrane protein [Sinomicrobium weinanense]|uniref:RagB/SusD family nutrient uptake outer membrane protein n=1 Tax=Sinomicrobium weinanense TaxID=2842200 RepID=A0A926JTA7_9FLAO|nr:RagB/SusD family nutrient uptake outer membrane protein [Sinomicrobium weinanense]MBC9797105.1 RagB/SusD family nutrient uptake outer membrane protein [Sinomicrobium weinanense]MBU3124801.1 RagB/SusD family nutrient uptake outer membrane protein [Sinomicrobium weinanense]
MKKHIYTLLALVLLAAGCNDDDFLDREPTQIIPDDKAYNSYELTLSILADLYSRYDDFRTVENWQSLSGFNLAFWSDNGSYGNFENNSWGFGSWGTWNYGYIRDLNIFINEVTASEGLEQDIKDRFLAEARFLRASCYFSMVTRMGGVPLILEPLEYDYSGDPTYLEHPRETEAAIYDFVINEAEEIKDILPQDANTKSRASMGAALAMQCRAALYAGSIAKYGASTPQVSLPGGEVGIPEDRANDYYTTALNTAKKIINGEAGAYGLYQKKPDDLADNFASIFYDKATNPEAIFVEDYKLQTGKRHGFTISNQPRFGAEEEEGGRINPSLNLVQAFETLNGEFAPIPNKDASGEYIVYDGVKDIFMNRDARLEGTVIVPGSSFKGKTVDILAGLQMPDGSVVSGDSRGQSKNIDGNNVQVVGFDGPIDGLEHVAQTGFYIRKYLDPKDGSGQRGVQSDVWFIRYRFGEVLLNAAEAAFELGQPDVAAEYMNRLRERAGITVPLASGDITFDRIAHERFVELAFEGLFFFDIKRWRIAHIVMDGAEITAPAITQNIGSATKPLTQPYGLWPYKIHDPGDPDHEKYIFKIVRPSRVTASDRFRFGNYYSMIGQDVLNNNSKIVKNPNH